MGAVPRALSRRLTARRRPGSARSGAHRSATGPRGVPPPSLAVPGDGPPDLARARAPGRGVTGGRSSTAQVPVSRPRRVPGACCPGRTPGCTGPRRPSQGWVSTAQEKERTCWSRSAPTVSGERAAVAVALAVSPRGVADPTPAARIRAGAGAAFAASRSGEAASRQFGYQAAEAEAAQVLGVQDGRLPRDPIGRSPAPGVRERRRRRRRRPGGTSAAHGRRTQALPGRGRRPAAPASAWSAVVRDGAVAVTCNGSEFYRPRPGLVPEAWTQMVMATGRLVLVWLPGASPPDDEEVLALLRRGVGLWGTVALSES